MATATETTSTTGLKPTPSGESEATPRASPEGEGLHEPPLHPPTEIKAILKKPPQIVPTASSAGSTEGEETEPSAASPAPAADGRRKKKKKKKKALKWDEHAIEEHDQLRGTRMKIDEPDTPFAHYDHPDDSDDGSGKHPHTPPTEEGGDGSSLAHNWHALENKLAGVAAAREAYPSSPSASSRDGAGSGHSDEEEAARRRRRHEVEFKMHRKHHYNEVEMMRKWKAEHPNNPLDDDEDDNDNDGMEL